MKKVLSFIPLITVVLLSACFPDFPEVTIPENPSEPIPILSEPVVRIVDPMPEDSFDPSVMFRPPGLAVEVEGDFVPGQTLHLMASRVQSPGIGFHVQTYPVRDTLSPGTLYVRTTPAIVGGTRTIWLKLRVFTATDRVLSIDSLRLHLR